MTNSYFTAADFQERRRRIFHSIGTEASVLIRGAGPVAGFEVFRQTNEFYYLTGIAVPQAYLLMDGARRRSVLYLPHGDTHASTEGAAMSADDEDALKQISGVDAVYGLEQLSGHLAHTPAAFYLPHSPAEGRLACQDTLRPAAKAVAADPWDAAPSRETALICTLRGRRPKVVVHDLSPILDEMRLIKSESEIAVMRRAGALSARSVAEAIRATRPGLYEYQLGAVADYVYQVNGAQGGGYRPIIAGGENIWYSHYYRNDCLLRSGDLVLMDYAPDVGNYTSDIGRLWPVNGRYSPVQRQLYGFVWEYHQALLARIRPEATPRQIMAEAADVMRPAVEAMAFAKPIYREAARRALDFQGHLSHPVGMAVHDVGRYFDRPLLPGLVFSVDPQIWIPEENLYLRVEDTVVVTADGIEVLTAGCPSGMDAVEALMIETGLTEQFPMTVTMSRKVGMEETTV